MNNKKFVTDYQLFTAVVVTVIGVGVFSYPADITAAVKTDGWIETIFAGAIVLLFTYMIYKIIDMNDYNNFYSILINNFGKFLGNIFTIIFSSYCILYLSIGMRIFTEVLKMFLFDKTPLEFLIIILIFTGIYVIRCGVDTLIKFNEICFFVMMFFILFTIILVIPNVNFTNILPIMHNKPMTYIKAFPVTFFSFAGFEIIYLILPYIKNKRNIPKVLFKSITLITFLFAINVIFCVGIFNIKQTELLIWPTLSMIKSIDIKDSFVEQWVGIAMIYWILFYITTFVNYCYLGADIIKSALKINDIKISAFIIIPVIYILSLYPENIVDVYKVIEKAGVYMGYFNIIFLTILLLIVSWVKKRGKKNEKFKKN